MAASGQGHGAEKFAIIRLVELSHLTVRRALAKIGSPPTTFYLWYDRFVKHGHGGLEDRSSSPSRVWNRMLKKARDLIPDLGFKQPELSPNELVVRFTDTEDCFALASGAGVFMARSQWVRQIQRLVILSNSLPPARPHDLVTSPVFIVITTADGLKDVGGMTAIGPRECPRLGAQPDVAD